ncbi:MAG: TonB-dependent receptor [Pseudomonadota bacterium]
MCTPDSAKPWRKTTMLVAVSSVLSYPSLSQAQQAADVADTNRRVALEEVIVTASKREQNLQDVAAAVTALTGNDIETLGATDITDLAHRVPGLSVIRTDRSNNQLAIRGLTSFTSNPSEFPMVGVYFDEVPISESRTPDIGLVDLARVEVLRGPQGTLYGEGSMGGTIKYISNRPDVEQIGGFLSGEGRSIDDGGDGYKAEGAINLPIIKGSSAFRLAGLYEDGYGFITNEANGEDNADDYKRYALRGSLLFDLTDALSVTLMGAYQKFEGGIPPSVFPEAIDGVTPPGLEQPSETAGYRVAPMFTNDEINIFNALIEYDLGSAVITSSTSYYDRDRDGSADEATTARIVEDGFAPLGALVGISDFTVDQGVRTQFDTGNEVFSQEIRLVSNGDGPLGYAVGAYYRDRDVDTNNDTVSDDLGDINPLLFQAGISSDPDYVGGLQLARSSVNFKQWAVFSELTYNLTEKFAVTGGLRYFKEDVKGNQFIAVPDTSLSSIGSSFFQPIVSDFPELETSDDDVLWKLVFSYDATDDMLLYAQAATGFRPGGVNPRANPDPNVDSPNFFDSDSVTSFEVGMKSQWWDGRAVVNLAAYYSELDDAQFQDSRDPQFPVVRNSGGAEVSGVEAELSVFPIDSLQLGLNFSIIDAEFSEDSLPFVDANGNTIYVIEDGQQIPLSRDKTASIFADYRQGLSYGWDLFAYGEVNYADGTPVNTVREETGTGFNFYTLDDATVLNMQLGLETDVWRVVLFVDNATDEFIEVGGSPADGIARDYPRSFGLRGRISF